MIKTEKDILLLVFRAEISVSIDVVRSYTDPCEALAHIRLNIEELCFVKLSESISCVEGSTGPKSTALHRHIL